MCISNGLHYKKTKYFIMNSTLLLFNKWLQRFITQCTHSYITIIIIFQLGRLITANTYVIAFSNLSSSVQWCL